MATGRAPLFDDVERTDATPGGHRESTFDFLNRVAGDYWEHPRALIQEWLDHLQNAADYTDLRQRFRSADDEQFRSAFLELYLHESLIRAGYMVTIHPTIEGTTSRPDFLAELHGERLYIEAIAPGSTPEAKAAAQRQAVLLDTINRLDDPNFLLSLEHLAHGPNPPAGRQLRKELRQWLAGLNPDDPWESSEASVHHWQHDGWSATFRAIPIRPEARGRRPGSRAIGVYAHTGVDWIDDAPAIRKALINKHHEYGDLGAPFIIAVGTYIHDRDRWHTTNAMYGAAAVQWYEDPQGKTVTRQIRQPNGYFGLPPLWQHRHVSGVLLVNQLMPYHFHRAEVTMWKHPNPTHGLPENLDFPWRTITFDGAASLVETPQGGTAADFFGVQEPWPPGEAWPDDS